MVAAVVGFESQCLDPSLVAIKPFLVSFLNLDIESVVGVLPYRVAAATAEIAIVAIVA